MSIYCECGELATRFSDICGNELEDPMCDVCFNDYLNRIEEALSSSETQSKDNIKSKTTSSEH